MKSASIGAGHGKQDSKSAGASSELLKESIENRKVKDEVIRLLKENNVKTFDTTVDYPNSKSDCLSKIVSLCNRNETDLDISIHFNSEANDIEGNGKSTGVECWIYNPNSNSKPYAERICNSIASLGFKNRGVKYSKEFSVLKTKNPCVIVEVCFVDDKDDINLYNYKTVAKAIVEGLLDKKLEVPANKKYENCILYGNEVDKLAADVMDWELKDCLVKPVTNHIAWEGNNLYVVGEPARKQLEAMKTNEKYTAIVGEDRWDTLKKSMKFVGK